MLNTLQEHEGESFVITTVMSSVRQEHHFSVAWSTYVKQFFLYIMLKVLTSTCCLSKSDAHPPTPTPTYTRTPTPIHTHTHTYTHPPTHTHTHLHTHPPTHPHTYTHAHPPTPTYTRTPTHTYNQLTQVWNCSLLAVSQSHCMTSITDTTEINAVFVLKILHTWFYHKECLSAWFLPLTWQSMVSIVGGSVTWTSTFWHWKAAFCGTAVKIMVTKKIPFQ